MITPVILCGGSGTRLWPLSRQSYPKQFVPLTGPHSLFQASVLRLVGEGFAPPVIITHADFRFIVTEQLADIGIDPGAILLEPEVRNTAPAVLAATLWQQDRDPDGLMLVAPSDHVIPDTDAFQAAIHAGAAVAQAGRLITFGIPPTRAETGYGYLELGTDLPPGTSEPAPLARFVEKPDPDTAAKMAAAGRFLWNAGLFLFSPAAMCAAFEQHAPDMIPPVQAAMETGGPDLGFFRLDPAAWAGIEAISIDYAVMEKAANTSVIPYSGHWSDLGDWDAVWRDSSPDDTGVVTGGPATALDCTNTLLRAEDTGQSVVGIGLRDTIVVAMPDAVLVADAGQAQEVKAAVARLKDQNTPQADTFPKVHRPWGWFESLAIGGRFQVKRIVVHPGAALSLQSHHHRSEHWIVVEGTAKVTLDGAEQLVGENQSVYIPMGAKHRLENPGKLPMVLIEVQTGAYLGEDDIVRFDDAYARS